MFVKGVAHSEFSDCAVPSQHYRAFQRLSARCFGLQVDSSTVRADSYFQQKQALKTHWTLCAQHQMPDRQSWLLAQIFARNDSAMAKEPYIFLRSWWSPKTEAKGEWISDWKVNNMSVLCLQFTSAAPKWPNQLMQV